MVYVGAYVRNEECMVSPYPYTGMGVYEGP